MQDRANEEARLRQGLDDLQRRFGPDCEERRAVMAYQFEQLWALVLPPHMRFLLWMMVQPEEFYARGRSAATGLRAAKAATAAASASGSAVASSSASAAGPAQVVSGSAEGGSSGALSDLGGAEEGADEGAAVTVDTTGSGRSELWPLLSQELGLTQEQEEKVRQVQRRLRENKEAWAEQVSTG